MYTNVHKPTLIFETMWDNEKEKENNDNNILD